MAHLVLSPDELKSKAEVSPADVLLAVAMWKRYAPPAYRSIIEADDKKFKWNASRMEYTRNGARIDPQKLRTLAIEPFLLAVKTAMRGLSAQLQEKRISLPEWQAQMADFVKHSQLAAALVANGGNRQDQTDYAAIALSILAMLAFLQTFAGDVDGGKQLLNGTLLSRTGLYANAIRDAYEQARREGISSTGATMERRVLLPGAEHCTSDDEMEGCIELAEMGWQPIGTLPRLYDTPCRTNCLCHFEYK
jgi:hypothetical protein